MSLADFAARRLLIAAWVYEYGAASGKEVMTDAEYDDLARYVNMHYDELHPDRKKAIPFPDDKMSACHMVFNDRIASAAKYWLENNSERDKNTGRLVDPGLPAGEEPPGEAVYGTARRGITATQLDARLAAAGKTTAGTGRSETESEKRQGSGEGTA